ncbi:MAG TPA: hypothetical protein V6D06_10910 [Trichocoleus sp.]
MLEFVSSRFQLPKQDVAEILQVHQMAQDFRREVEQREQFEAYCAWYNHVSLQNQLDWAAMQKEAQLLDWFKGHRS